jgi:hypothetical protein
MDNKKSRKEYNKKYYAENKEKILAHAVDYYESKKDERLKYQIEYDNAHKEERKEYKKHYYKKNDELFKKKYKRNDLKRKFGITQEEYNIIYESQNGCCLICGSHSNTHNKALAVDHNHTTGKIRGLLCAKCNQGLGLFRDDINILTKAIDYLQKNDN